MLVRHSSVGWLQLASLPQAMLQLAGPQQAFLQLGSLQQGPEHIRHADSGCAGQTFCCLLAALGKPTAGYAAGGKPIAGFLQLAGLQQGLPQQAFHGQVCYSRFATTRFPGTGLLQQACHNKVSTGTFATAGLQHQVFHGQVCFSRFATTRFPGAGLL